DSGERPERLVPSRECYRAIVTSLEDLTLGSGDFSRFLKWDAWAPCRILMGFWTSYGVDAAVEILCAPIPFSSGGRSSSEHQSINLTALEPDAEGIPHGSSHMHHEPLWWALRCHLFQLSEADFASALVAAAPHYERLKTSTEISAARNTTSLAFAFSRDGTWLHEVAQRLASGDESIEHVLQIVAGLTDSTLAMECIERCLWSYTTYLARYYAFDMIESLGPAGTIAVLERLCEACGARSSDKKKLQSALKLARTAL
ncbi:MAG: hypothetical protein ACI8RZ_007366, partial [Myxococcota bacterium]